MSKELQQIHQRFKFRTQASNKAYEWDYIEQLVIENEQNRKDISELKKANKILCKFIMQLTHEVGMLDIDLGNLEDKFNY